MADKRLIAVDTPRPTRPGDRDRRHRVADSYVRFWLAFLEQGIAETERGRGRLVAEAVERGWTSWRGRAIEPVVRRLDLVARPRDRTRRTAAGPRGAAARSNPSYGSPWPGCCPTGHGRRSGKSAAGGPARTTPRWTW
ncbi:hypothetical protein [Streptomyces caeruleatus]|uniref:hypothetical protein n=1 Tax=Streptomyces caeruleatus TaxID=661399 RepID=UPI001FCA08B3|nr:hypothetical protein [Streptomyces caeruleatus]